MGKNLKGGPFSSKGGTTMAFTSKQNLAIVYRTTRSLSPDPKNPRLHSEKQVQQIARSIEAFGFNVPLLVDAEMQVVAGHGRLEACQLLGIMEVPTISLEHLTEAQARAFMIADNRLTENAAWDDRLLAQQFKDLSEVELDFSLEATGFEMGEIDVLVENLAPAAVGEDDPADAVPEPTVGIEVSKAGDLWQLGRHKVYCGNSLNEPTYAALMGDAKATMSSPILLTTFALMGMPPAWEPFNTKTSKWHRAK
jgi:hypothetical protein